MTDIKRENYYSLKLAASPLQELASDLHVHVTLYVGEPYHIQYH